jgi:UDP-N-acetylmuramate dehydrogenase
MMSTLDAFSEILLRDEPLAPYTWLKIGGPAQFLLTPRTVDELQAVVRACHLEQLPIRLLGSGSNLLVRDEGVSGAVIKLSADAFCDVVIDGNTCTAFAGATLSNVISHTARAGLAGLDSLVGIPGTIGGALCGNAGGRMGDIGQFIHSVEVLTHTGDRLVRRDDELAFEYRDSNLREFIILSATFALHPESADEITARMKKLWIMKKATQPLTFQSAGCIFKNPRGLSAGMLIDRAGLKGTRIGHAEISDRHANFIVTQPGAKSNDVLRLIELARSRVNETFGVELELEIRVW